MKPPVPQQGDTFGLIAPASLPLDPDRLPRGVAHLGLRGFHIKRFRSEIAPHGYLAGSDPDRLAELNRALQDPDISMLFCVRGGYGSLRLLGGIDYDAARECPKVLIGYSDVTALQLALWARSGIRSVSGSMVAVDWADPNEATERLFWRVLSGPVPLRVEGPAGSGLSPLRPGTAEGILLGGNLTMVTRLLGTPYLPDMEGAILFLEDVGEAPYRIDGLLAHLKLSGVLDKISGLVFGQFTGWEPTDARPTLTYADVLGHYASTLSIPVATGLLYGHLRVHHAIPIGVRGRLDVTGSTASLTILESPTA